VNPFGRASQADGLFGVDPSHARTDSFTMRASSTGGGLERYYSALSTQPSWAGVGGQQSAGPGWSPHAGAEWASSGGGPFGVPQLDLPQMPLPGAQQEVRPPPIQPRNCVSEHLPWSVRACDHESGTRCVRASACAGIHSSTQSAPEHSSTGWLVPTVCNVRRCQLRL